MGVESRMQTASSVPVEASDPTVEVLLTAGEAYPALERCFLAAKHEIWASFLVFDPMTRLRSPEGRAVGTTWFDLIVHTLRRGVAIRIVISDVDPIARAAMHRATWRSTRLLSAAAEVAGPEARLAVLPAMHASETGLLPRIIFAPVILARLYRTARWLNRLDPVELEAARREIPGVTRRMVQRADGTFRPRKWPIPRLFPGTHHQKVAVFDREAVYIGGLDLNERRYDTPRHDRPAEETWHDVQLLIRGPVALEAQEHLETFLAVTEGRADPPVLPKLLRTMSRKRRYSARWLGPMPVVSEIAAEHDRLIQDARELIYLESQYFRDPHLTRRLAEAGRKHPDLSLILILPGAPDELAFEGRDGLDVRIGEHYQARCIRKLEKAFGPRLFVGGAAQRRRSRLRMVHDRDRLGGAPMIYVHAKVSIFDRRAAIVSSANLNGRSLRWDTEAGVLLDQAEDVERLRGKVMAHWLPPDAGRWFFDPRRAVRAWRALAIENARRSPDQRSGFIMPYDLAAAERISAAFPFLPSEMV